jgi:DNA repair protein RadC
MKTNYGEFRVLSLREVALAYTADTPGLMATYWRDQIATGPSHDPDKETMVVVLLNTRMRVIGHSVVAVGVVDQVLCHAREVFRPAIVGAAKSLCLMHNHPSGDASPSDADIRITRQMVEAGKILGVDVTDHVIIGQKTDTSRGYTSLRELGFIATGR